MGESTVQSRAIEPVTLATPLRPNRLGRVWNDVPLRNKTVLLIVLAAVGGALIGMLESSSGHPGWMLSLGLTALVGTLLALSKGWIGTPIDHLVEQLGRISREYSLPAINALPIERRDEVGQIARAIHQIASWSRRDYFEARHLRRTLDHRVAQATRTATRELRHMALRDPLTDLGNRRFLDEHLEPLVHSIRESNAELICVVIDVDNFKQVNDAFGHSAGDQVLIFLASLLRSSIRQQDYAVRLGGDEFALFLPGCTVERAGELAKSILSLFQQRVRQQSSVLQNTGLSMGIASLNRDQVASGQELLDRADAHLYDAKRAGKNQAAGT